ncbi:MAG: guanylate kinase [Bacteroidota bacterium]|nr:guanylate kinase [Bacteroidota bacterium]
MVSQGKLIIFSAPSGAGKTTIVRHLLAQIPTLEFSVSATSRAPRGDESHGVDYYFFAPDEFRKRVNEDEFVEWEEVYPGQMYGTLLTEVDRIWRKGHHVIFDVDVKGGLNLKKKFGSEALAIFVRPPSMEALEERLRSRATEPEEKIRMRLAKAASELSFESRFDTVLVNDDLERAVNEGYKKVTGFLYAEKKLEHK